MAKRRRRDVEDDTDVQALLAKAEPRFKDDDPDEGPWRAAAGVAAGAFVVGFVAMLIGFGTSGMLTRMAESDRLPTLGALAFFQVGMIVGIFWGLSHVKSQFIPGKFGTKTTGTKAVAIGFAEAIGCALLAGAITYEVIFQAIKLL